MFKSLAILSIFTAGVSFPSLQNIQPLRGATLSVSQLSLDWGVDGFEAKLAEEADFALKIKLRGDHAVTLKF